MKRDAKVNQKEEIGKISSHNRAQMQKKKKKIFFFLKE